MSQAHLYFAVLLFALGSPMTLAAEDTQPRPPAMHAAAGLAATVAKAPALTAARARAEAARERLGSAARFPDLEVEGMLSRKNTPDENMPMWEFAVRQPLPKSGERAADRDRALAVVAMAEAEFFVMAGEMAADAAMALAEAETSQLRTEALSGQIVRIEQILSAVDARIATGQGKLGDRLALQTRIDAMRLMIERERRMSEDALDEARGLLGLQPKQALPPFAAPSTSEINPAQAPTLKLANARSAEAQAMTRMARASAKPMTAVGLRFERERERMGNNDTIGVAFMMELPMRSRRYARAEERAAQSEATAALAQAHAAGFRIDIALKRVERAERLAETARHLAQETRKRLEADYEMLVRSAGTGALGNDSSLLMLLEILEKTTDTQLQMIDADGSARVARAELWRYVPANAFPNP